MTEANEKYIRTISIPKEETIATVSAWPGEVMIAVTAYDNSFKVDQARELAALILAAADDAEHIGFKDETLETLDLVDDRH
jgi:hypothetical protein